jgi:hypothetical protein
MNLPYLAADPHRLFIGVVNWQVTVEMDFVGNSLDRCQGGCNGVPYSVYSSPKYTLKNPLRYIDFKLYLLINYK